MCFRRVMQGEGVSHRTGYLMVQHCWIWNSSSLRHCLEPCIDVSCGYAWISFDTSAGTQKEQPSLMSTFSSSRHLASTGKSISKLFLAIFPTSFAISFEPLPSWPSYIDFFVFDAVSPIFGIQRTGVSMAHQPMLLFSLFIDLATCFIPDLLYRCAYLLVAINVKYWVQ